MNRWYWVINDKNRAHLARVVLEAIRTAPAGYIIAISEATRTLKQNAKLWPMLTDVSNQVLWDGQRMSKDEWKDWFTAALKQQRMVRGMEPGTIVFVGTSTSSMGKREFSDLIEVMYLFGANNNVDWSENSRKRFAELRAKERQEHG